MSLLLSYAAWLVVPLGLFIGGLLVARKERPGTKLKIGLALLLAPPVLLAVAYYAASSTGCSGGDCTGPMLGLLLLAVPVAAIALFGLGMVLQAGIRCAVAAMR